MLARIIKTEAIEKPKYKAYKVTYKNLETGKPLSTNVVNFGDTLDVYNKLATVKVGDVFDVTVVKNGDFYNWVKMEPAAAPAEEAPEQPSAAAAGRRGATSTAREWEDASERALRQILIVRQSSVSTAVAAVVGGAIDGKELFPFAEKVEAWVFRDLKAVDRPINVQDAMKELLAMKDDIPA